MRPVLFALSLCITLTSVVCLTPHKTHATTLLYAPVKTLFAHASHIIEGSVTSSRTLETQHSPFVFTEYTVSTKTTHACSTPCPSTFLIRIPGGKLPSGRSVSIEGMPTLPLNTPLLLALEPLPTQAFPKHTTPSYLPLGLQQGIFVRTENTFTRPPLHAPLLCGSSFCPPNTYQRSFPLSTLRDLARTRTKTQPARTP